jgi:hypothetical protein
MTKTTATVEPFRFNLQQFADDGVETTETVTLEPETSTAEKIYSADYVQKITQENKNRRLRERELEERLAKMSEIEKELTKFREAESDRERKRLEEAGEYKTLAQKADDERRAYAEEANARVQASRRLAIEAKAEAALIRLGIKDPDDVRLLDLDRVEWDDERRAPKNLDDIVEAFHKAKPDKFGTNEQPSSVERRAVTTTPSSPNARTKGDDAFTWDRQKLDSEWASIRL